MWQMLSPTALLLLVSAGTRAEDHPKAKVTLDPQWNRVLKDDEVVLRCQGSYSSEDHFTQWFHNGTVIENQSSSYSIAAARVEDSGVYQCKTALSPLSDPVQLEVHTDWLLLQASRWVYEEGDPIVLRCHSWKNKHVHKVQYFKDGRGRKFSYQNSEFHIPKARQEDSGSYFCRALIGPSRNESSKAMNVIVKGPTIPPDSPLFPSWIQVTFCLVMGLLFAVDTGLYVSVQRDLRNSMRDQKNVKVTWSRGS
ncbi:low affinity immunoglobulin gamma Fc region receptor III-A [Equus przewalskii]|uniref:Low affinity immunoglobulin gamma Fc region receptor III-A n=1 Tax=Equus caballus TaxID=9796 RepID=F7DJH2_HORSE|nr:low affinity immunoglobulin gamma Fc region receptor III-B precursor [Equus caballus]XP_005609951.1 low affinity immunoglobulin gamma Fc region receptor III-B isoform X1 [Equus caballus]XP_008505754.1 PREDICTED: low affinity immunoglobulin gamma Fc region receptor III-A isoform X1 [Equus przewalskii]XP_008505755.1 PREDICTED: low affinity immunoglobulin gamma Fc region receptor III-A isoform X1 [Equus przewalskii]AEZ56996.1 low affinity immunoglobulin gamma Fc region receptor III transmembran